MDINPTKDRIVLKTSTAEEKTKGGIYIPQSAKEKPNQGEVVAVWDEKDSPVKVGDKVIYEGYAGTEVELEKKTFLIVNIKDILGVLK